MAGGELSVKVAYGALLQEGAAQLEALLGVGHLGEALLGGTAHLGAHIAQQMVAQQVEALRVC